MSRKIVLVAALMLFVLTACQTPYQWRAGDYDAKPAPDFTLPDAAGGDFRLSAQRGTVILLFFGYTSCPDECPTTLSDIRQALQALGDDAKMVRVVFVSVDPARDSALVMQQYVARFGPNFIGLRAEQAALDPVLKDYGITVRFEPDGTVTHPIAVLVIDQKGTIRVRFPFGLSTASMAADIAHIVKG